MPQGPEHLHKKFGDDSVADALLVKAGYRYDHEHFTYYVPKGHNPTKDEIDAMDYLVLEWDYGIEYET